MPLKFYYTDGPRRCSTCSADPRRRASLHHLAAIVTFLYFALHLSSPGRQRVANRADSCAIPTPARIQLRAGLVGSVRPDSMVPSFQDWPRLHRPHEMVLRPGPEAAVGPLDVLGALRLFRRVLGRRDHRLLRLGAVVPEILHHLPARLDDQHRGGVHSDEALLAAGFIFTFHFFNTHFRFEKFPMDTVIFSGHISKTEMLHERRRWYDRLVASGRLDQHRVLHSDWEARKTTYKALGFVFLGIGVCHSRADGLRADLAADALRNAIMFISPIDRRDADPAFPVSHPGLSEDARC